MKIKLMNKIASVGTDVFDKSRYTIGEDVVGAEAIMVRSEYITNIGNAVGKQYSIKWVYVDTAGNQLGTVSETAV